MFEPCSKCGIKAGEMRHYFVPQAAGGPLHVYLCSACNQGFVDLFMRYVFGRGEDFAVSKEPAWFTALGLKGS